MTKGNSIIIEKVTNGFRVVDNTSKPTDIYVFTVYVDMFNFISSTFGVIQLTKPKGVEQKPFHTVRESIQSPPSLNIKEDEPF